MPAIADTGKRAVGFLGVRASVQPSAAVKLDFKSTQIVVTDGDISRGYVELPASSVVSVQAGGLVPEIVMDFTPMPDAFKSMEIRAAHSSAAAGGTAERRLPETSLSYRFNLADGARPGLYPLPLTFNVTL